MQFQVWVNKYEYPDIKGSGEISDIIELLLNVVNSMLLLNYSSNLEAFKMLKE